MAIKVLELHHHGIRIGTSAEAVEQARQFYTDVLGLQPDPGRPDIRGIPGFWLFVGDAQHTTQIHLMGAEGMSPMARSARKIQPFRMSPWPWKTFKRPNVSWSNVGSGTGTFKAWLVSIRIRCSCGTLWQCY